MGRTVADALVSAGIDPTEHLGVSPSLDSPLRPGMDICAPRTLVRVVEESDELAFSTVKTSDPSLPLGETEVVVGGKQGSVVRIYRTVVSDGVESARTLVSQRIVAAPVNRLLAVGTARTMVARATAVQPRLVRVSNSAGPGGTRMTVSATAYAPGVDSGGFGTATGIPARLGVIAVDPRVIPLGSRIFVPGYGYGTAADTGGAIKGARIDVCFNSSSQAVRWGRRNVSIVVLD